MANKREFKDDTVCGLYRGRNNENFYYSLTISPQTFEQIQKLEIGGKLTVRILSEEQREKMMEKREQAGKNPDGAPFAFVGFETKEEVAAFNADRPQSSRSDKF